MVVTDGGSQAISGGPTTSADPLFEAALVELYADLLRVAVLIARHQADAEDALQLALERAWRSRHQLRDRALLRPWLTRIVAREIVRRQTSPWARLVRTAPSVVDLTPAPSADQGDDLSIVVGQALARLSPPQRTVVVLHHYAGYPVVEVAILVNAPVETVRSRLRLAMARLRADLSE